MRQEKTDILGLHYGRDGVEQVTDPKRAAVLRAAAHEVHWGRDEKDTTVDVGGGDVRRPFHPGRDYKWGKLGSIARLEQAQLRSAGISIKSDLFRGEDGLDDISTLWDIVDGERKHKSRGHDGAWLLDNAPNLFIAQETIRQTGEIEEETMVELSAATLIPSVTYNTWMDAYRYDRRARKLNGIAMPTNMSAWSGQSTPQSGTVENLPVYKALTWFASGASWEFFELEYLAEARSNGAPNFDMVRERMDMAILQHKLTYNGVTLFGWPDMSITGVLDAPELANETVPAAQQLGANGIPEEDVQIFVDAFTAILDATLTAEKPDTIAMGRGAWTYINTTDYKSVDAGMNESIAQAIMRKLGPLGLKDMLWIPEMEFRQAQADAWQDEIPNFPTALAERWAGGINRENVMLIFRKSPQTGRMPIGKPMGARPQETVQDVTTVRMVQSLGSFDVRKPKSFRIVTDIGPA